MTVVRHLLLQEQEFEFALRHLIHSN